MVKRLGALYSTNLYRAFNNGKKEVIPVLLKYGADLHATNNDGQTPWSIVFNAGLKKMRKHVLKPYKYNLQKND